MSQSVDVVIVGAGIHGAGMAQAAAAAGHSVLLLERSGIAAATSSRSSKLIHGGLRYLETGQIHLVRESLRERALMLRLAPQLVHLRRFLVPIYRRTRRRPWQIRLGLTLYAGLAGFGPGAGFGSIPRRQWATLDGLCTQDLQAVFYYHDAQTDDRALTQAVVRSACRLGAQLACPARFLGATLQEDGVEVRFCAEGVAGADGQAPAGAAVHSCQARVLINAGGPWASDIAHAISPTIAVPRVEQVQGTHIVLPVTVEQGCYYLESPRDGRAVFALPWKGALLVGTTETSHRGDPATVMPRSADIHYLLGVIKHYFPRCRPLSALDVLTSFAGVRVLPQGPGHPFHRSRETQLITDRPLRPRVLSIYGGKLTTWRSVAQRALRCLSTSLPAAPALARTDELPLSACDDTQA